MYVKLPSRVQARFEERLFLFQEDPLDPTLRDHALHGEFVEYRSINITGNVRAIYKRTGADTIEFAKIGTHHELYGT